MLPERGFLGIECGIQGSLTLKCKKYGFNIHVEYDFPACGDDTLRANSMGAEYVKCAFYDNGKYGEDNPHNLILSIARNPQSEIDKKSF